MSQLDLTISGHCRLRKWSTLRHIDAGSSEPSTTSQTDVCLTPCALAHRQISVLFIPFFSNFALYWKGNNGRMPLRSKCREAGMAATNTGGDDRWMLMRCRPLSGLRPLARRGELPLHYVSKTAWRFWCPFQSHENRYLNHQRPRPEVVSHI